MSVVRTNLCFYFFFFQTDGVISRYAFRSTEKVALQEIGPRFTLKLRSLKKGLPAVNYLGDVAKPLEFDTFSEAEEKMEEPASDDQGELDTEGEPTKEAALPKKVPPKAEEYEWVWKVKFSCGLHCPVRC